MPPLPSSIGARVVSRRSELRLTQRDLADRCGCAVTTISRIECGMVKGVSQHLLENLSVALDVPIDWLVRGKAKAGGRAS